MALRVFFSWQLDTPSKGGRNLILRALENAITSISSDLTLEETVREIEIDRDTLDVPGTPPIVDTIFRKIDNATFFVPDLTFVGSRKDGRLTPNPNVLIEYGWALKTLGHSRMLPIMNTAFGGPEGDALPFDMRHLRHPLQYDCAEGADDATRAAARNKLAVALKTALTAMLSTVEANAPLAQPAPEIPFEKKQALDGPGRFRKKGESIGISDDGFISKAEDVHLLEGSTHWLRVTPSVSTDKFWSLAEIKKVAFTRSIILPISSSTGGGSFSYIRAEDGVGLYSPLYANRGTTNWVVFVFTSGEIWSCDSYIIPATGEKAPGHIYLNRADLARCLGDYTRCLIELGVSAPVKWELGIEGVKGRGIFIANDPFSRARGACVANNVIVSGTYYPDDDPSTALEPFFSKVYDLCGLSGP